MIRLLGNPTAGYNTARLRQEAQIAFPGLLDFNDVGGKPAFYFEVNAPTQAQIDALVAAHVNTPPPPSNEEVLRSRAEAALATNATFLALASPSNALVAAQTKALTRQVNALIRLTLGRTETFDGT